MIIIPMRRSQRAVDARLRPLSNGSMRWVSIGLVMSFVAGFAACSSDGEGGGGAAASGVASGTNTSGAAGAASGSGGSGGTGGTGGSGAGDCIDYMPPAHDGGPVQLASSCPSTMACGGTIDGEWDLKGGCVPMGDLF